jgi:hypothetical protein
VTFVILGYDGPEGQARRKLHRPAHLARVEALAAQGRLVLAGPLTDGVGSLIIIEADSRAEAEEFIKNDPYVLQGVFQRYEIHPFQQVLP